MKSKITIPRGFIFVSSNANLNSTISIDRLKEINSLIKSMTKDAILIDSKLLNSLLYIDDIAFTNIKKELDSYLECSVAIYLKPSFSTKSKISKESMTYKDLRAQFIEYIFAYDLDSMLIFNDDIEKLNKNNKIKKISKQFFKVITSKNEIELNDFVLDMIHMPIVFGETQREMIEESLINNLLNVDNIDLNLLKIKENNMFIIDMLYKYNKKINGEEPLTILKTTTDLLRYAMYVNKKGDNSDWKILSNEHKMDFDLSTSNKKRILKRLFELNNDTLLTLEEMFLKRNLWLSFAKNVHPNSNKYKKYNSHILFSYLYENRTAPKSFNRELDLALKNKKAIVIIDLLKSKPGLLLRYTDCIIRFANLEEIEYFKNILIGLKLNSKLILQVYNIIRYRKDNSSDERLFKIRKTIAIVKQDLSKLNSVNAEIIMNVLDFKLKENLKNKQLFN